MKQYKQWLLKAIFIIAVIGLLMGTRQLFHQSGGLASLGAAPVVLVLSLGFSRLQQYLQQRGLLPVQTPRQARIFWIATAAVFLVFCAVSFFSISTDAENPHISQIAQQLVPESGTAEMSSIRIYHNTSYRESQDYTSGGFQWSHQDVEGNAAQELYAALLAAEIDPDTLHRRFPANDISFDRMLLCCTGDRVIIGFGLGGEDMIWVFPMEHSPSLSAAYRLKLTDSDLRALIDASLLTTQNTENSTV